MPNTSAKTYQDMPWWVAENLTDQGIWGANLYSPSGYQAVRAGSLTDWNAFRIGFTSGQNISLHNITWHVVGGPYTTKAQATAAVKSIQAVNPAPGALQQGGLGGLQAVGDFFSRLTQKATWERIGEFLIGGVILYVALKGIVSPPGTPVARRTIKDTAKSTAKLAAKVIK